MIKRGGETAPAVTNPKAFTSILAICRLAKEAKVEIPTCFTIRHERAANDNVILDDIRPEDILTLKEVRFRYHLSTEQIKRLQLHCRFPAPIPGFRVPHFLRSSIDAWVSVQPNPMNLAAVLRIKRLWHD